MKIKLSKIKPNPKNPRVIKDHKFRQLVKSIQEFPEMLEIREIVIDEDNVILGGNMRYKACKEAGLKEVEVVVMSGLTDEQKDEFIIKDNANYGIWDWDKIANNYDELPLNDWGLSVWQPNLYAEVKESENEDGYFNSNDSANTTTESAEKGKREGNNIIQIEFKIDDYPIAFQLYQDMKEKKIDVGLILLNKLKEELCK